MLNTSETPAGSGIRPAHVVPSRKINRESWRGGTTEESNRWKSASLPESPVERNGWEGEGLQGSSTWHTLFQGHSWVADLATGVSGEPYRSSCGSPVDRTGEELEPGGNVDEDESRLWIKYDVIWLSASQQEPGLWILFVIHVLKR